MQKEQFSCPTSEMAQMRHKLTNLGNTPALTLSLVQTPCPRQYSDLRDAFCDIGNLTEFSSKFTEFQ